MNYLSYLVPFLCPHKWKNDDNVKNSNLITSTATPSETRDRNIIKSVDTRFIEFWAPLSMQSLCSLYGPPQSGVVEKE